MLGVVGTLVSMTARSMNENSDELDFAMCSRRARRWMLGLVLLLTINFSLVGLALGGFGAARRRPADDQTPVTTVSTAAEPTVLRKTDPPPRTTRIETQSVDPLPPQPADPAPSPIKIQ